MSAILKRHVDFELQPGELTTAEDRAAFAGELRHLAGVLNAEADRLDGGFMTTQEAAAAIGRSEENVRQWVRRFNIGRFDAKAHGYLVSRSKLTAHMLQLTDACRTVLP